MKVNVTRSVAVIFIVLLAFAGSGLIAARAEADDTLINTCQEVWALQGLRDLDLTPDQLKALKSLAEGASSPLGERDTAKANDKYATKLKALRAALVKGQDDDEIDALTDELEILGEEDDVDIDDGVAPSDPARTRAASVIKLLSSGQLASYIAAYEDEAPDPVQTILDAADDIRDSDEDEAKDAIADAADEVAVLVVGLEVAKQKPVQEKVRSYLQRAKKMSDADFKARRLELEKSAKDLIGDVDGFVILRHWMQRDMAELLSNPQLATAIDDRLKAGPVAEKE